MTDDLAFTAELIGRAVVEANSDAVVASDRDGHIRFWSPGAERMFGYSAAEALGQSLDVIIPERLRLRHWEGYRHVMATGKSRYSASEVLAVPAQTKHGTQISVEFTITPISSGAGDTIGLVAVLRDVTARFEETKRLRRQVRELTQGTLKTA